MSKRKVDEALEAAAAGEIDRAMASLRDVMQQFVRRRLTPLLEVDGRQGLAARRLWRALRFEPDAPYRPGEDDVTAVPAAPASALPPRAVRLPDAAILEAPEGLLARLPEFGPCIVDLDEVRVAQVWSLVALAALARSERDPTFQVYATSKSDVGRFARAIGFHDVINGAQLVAVAEPERTFPLFRITRLQDIERAANRIAQMMLPNDEEGRRTLYYVLVELMRNVVQHSRDPLGGVVAAQRMDAGQGYERPMMQVVVADTGIGILEALRAHHPELEHPRAAVTKALEPHVSGTFGEGRTGSVFNAGMGLFFIAEMAKLTAGRLMIATRGATLCLDGDVEGLERHHIRFAGAEGVGFHGTLVTFELPLSEVQDHDALLETIRVRAMQRTPRRTSTSWLRFGAPAEGVPVLVVHRVAEDTVAAAEMAREHLQGRILQRQPVALDFRGIEVATQSFLHALLFETLRLAWALQVEVWVTNAEPAVVSGLKLVENYALSG